MMGLGFMGLGFRLCEHETMSKMEYFLTSFDDVDRICQ